jgi:hypothetical protein
MKNRKKTFLGILLFSPICAFASGDNVLSSLYVTAASIIVFLIILVSIKLNYIKKLILAVYFLTLFFIFYQTRDVPYTENMNFINSLLTLLPIGTVSITYLILKFQNKKPT